jgi:hypothetical protein
LFIADQRLPKTPLWRSDCGKEEKESSEEEGSQEEEGRQEAQKEDDQEGLVG